MITFVHHTACHREKMTLQVNLSSSEANQKTYDSKWRLTHPPEAQQRRMVVQMVQS